MPEEQRHIVSFSAYYLQPSFLAAKSRLPDGFGIVKFAIQVAPRPRKGTIPPECVIEHRTLTSLLPVIADTGP
jgi:hypothetical protein